MVGWGKRLAARLGPRLGVRARSVLIAVGGVSVALLIGGTGLLWALRNNLEQSADAVAQQRAAEVVTQLVEEGLPRTSTALAARPSNTQFVQVLDPSGQIVAYSSTLVAERPLSTQRPAAGRDSTAEVDIDNLGEGGEWRVVATGVSTGGGTSVVLVAVPIRVQRETVQTVAVFLLGVTPLLLLGVAGSVWLLVGRALRSVERIRTQVAAIDAQRLTERVAVPPTRDEIAALASTMNVMLDGLQVSHRSQRAFVSDASHELRSPLATLTTAAELAVGADEVTRDRLLGTINAELARMRGLVDNLMTLARADAQDLLPNRADVDLDDLVHDEARRLRATSARRLELSVVPVRVWADQPRLAQALRNLVDNAERHARTTVRLSLAVEAGEAVLRVDNDGPVIEPADRERVFERFVRLDDSRSRDAGGSGLGLAIARTALRTQSGDVVVADAPDGWCRFELRLPPAPPAEPAQAAVVSSSSPAAGTSVGTPAGAGTPVERTPINRE
ncbi:sensor histidine kinase [uncultured Friedmanniella sp.]|uniref:sensor histidine kinase n=1 Tax=uncultured Friedmanniella sp. TaxID=335381 RepID=UPI0035CB0153